MVLFVGYKGENMRTYNVGMLGFGFMGKMHTYSYATIPFHYGQMPVKINLKMVCTNTAESGKIACEQYGFEKNTTNIDEFFNEDLDIIHICTPNLLHKDQILRCIEKGAHIYCEKPMTTNFEDAVEIYNKISQTDTKFQMVYNYRFFPCVLLAKEILKSNDFGEILNVRAKYLSNANLAKLATWRTAGENQGGVLFDLGSHAVDMIMHLCGDIKQVNGNVFKLNDEVILKNGDKTKATQNDGFISMIQLENGARGVIEANKISQGANNDFSVEINLEKGALKFNIDDPNWLYVYNAYDKDGDFGGDRGFKKIECLNKYNEISFPSPKHNIGWSSSHVHSLYLFLDSIKNNTKSVASIEESIRVQKVLDCIIFSHEINGIVDL